jgi:hypothetical protein
MSSSFHPGRGGGARTGAAVLRDDAHRRDLLFTPSSVFRAGGKGEERPRPPQRMGDTSTRREMRRASGYVKGVRT